MDEQDKNRLSVSKIHAQFVPNHDMWGGRLRPRIWSWLKHLGEVVYLLLCCNKPYTKHGRVGVTCKEHAKVEFGDLLWHTEEIVWMLTGKELNIAPELNLQRVYNRLEQNKKLMDNERNGKNIQP